MSMNTSKPKNISQACKPTKGKCLACKHTPCKRIKPVGKDKDVNSPVHGKGVHDHPKVGHKVVQ
jgi:hypothetical protein